MIKRFSLKQLICVGFPTAPFLFEDLKECLTKKTCGNEEQPILLLNLTFLEGKTKQWPLLCFCSVLEQHGLANKASIPTESFEKRFSRNLFLCLNSRHGKKKLTTWTMKTLKKNGLQKSSTLAVWPKFYERLSASLLSPLQVLRQRKLLAIAELIAEWKLLDVVVSFFFIVQETLFAKP